MPVCYESRGSFLLLIPSIGQLLLCYIRNCIGFFDKTKIKPLPYPFFGGCVEISFWSLRPTEGIVAFSLFSVSYEIASVVSLPGNDMMTQSLEQEGYVGLSDRCQRDVSCEMKFENGQ